MEICSYEDSGWNRRNLYTYDYKAHDTPNGQKYGVDIYETNDNGLNVGLNTSKLANYFYYNGELYPKSAAPDNPDKLYLATYIFENQSINSVFELISSPNNALVNRNSSIYYRINNIDSEKTVVFELDDKVEFIDAEVSEGDYHYDSGEHILYWNLPASIDSKEIVLNVKPKVKGYYNIHSYVQDMDAEIDAGAYATDYGIVLTSDNVTTFKTYHKSLDVYLTDDDGVALVGEKVSIIINGTTYVREVTPKGYASLAITFQPGEYDALISYDGAYGKNQTNSKFTVKKTLFTDDLNVFYGEVLEYNVSCLDEYGNPLTNYEVDFCIDGKLYDRYVNDEGVCSFNISELKPGNHSVITYNLNTNEFVHNSIYIKEPICDLEINKYAGEDIVYLNDAFLWKIEVTNHGPCDAHEVVVTDVLPSGIKYITHNASKGSYDAGSGKLTISDLENGETATLEIYCVALGKGIIVNEVNVTCNETDSNLSNNHDNCTVEVIKNETPVLPSPEKPVEPAKLLATGNPIAYLIVVIMVLFGSFWIPKRKI